VTVPDIIPADLGDLAGRINQKHARNTWWLLGEAKGKARGKARGLQETTS
jgi:hypothetical protein